MLKQYLVIIIAYHLRKCHLFTFQKDKASMHTAKKEQEWLRLNFIQCMKWLARSPHLIELNIYADIC